MKESVFRDKGIPVGQYVLFPSNFSSSPCEMCGKCCNNNWVVELSEEEYTRYKTILRNSDLPREYESCFEEIKKDGESIYKLLPRTGRCIFLLENNKCYIHSQHGPETKSRTCKYFPLEVSGYSPRGMHLKTSFSCPSILKSLLSSEEIQITRAEWKNDLLCSSHLTFYNDYTITWERLFSMSEAVSCLFLQDSYNAEQNLLIAGIWINAIYENFKQSKSEEIDLICNKEYLIDNRKSFLDVSNRLSPQYLEMMNLMSHIAHAMSLDKFICEEETMCSNKNKGILKSREMIDNMRNRLQEIYHDNYLNELQQFSSIIEKYLIHRIQSVGIFTQKGFIYGINYIVLCYAFFRMFLLVELICGKEKIDSSDVLEAISFVEENFFHRKSVEYLKSPQMMKILSNPKLFHFLLKL